MPIVPNRSKDRKRDFACATCGKAYIRKDTLMRHQTFECGKDPLFACQFCSYRAFQKVHLQSHVARKHFANV